MFERPRSADGRIKGGGSEKSVDLVLKPGGGRKRINTSPLQTQTPNKHQDLRATPTTPHRSILQEMNISPPNDDEDFVSDSSIMSDSNIRTIRRTRKHKKK